jgi:hypothetical protein
MSTYRLCFFEDGIICGRFDFQADDDDRAEQVGAILFDACSDRCRSWGIWEGEEFVLSGTRKLGPSWQASDLTERRQDNIAQCEEAILTSKWAIASSERLLAELDKLKRAKERRVVLTSYQSLPSLSPRDQAARQATFGQLLKETERAPGN